LTTGGIFHLLYKDDDFAGLKVRVEKEEMFQNYGDNIISASIWRDT
jgi:hypothetical protein